LVGQQGQGRGEIGAENKVLQLGQSLGETWVTFEEQTGLKLDKTWMDLRKPFTITG